jgi:hypothetical protein
MSQFRLQADSVAFFTSGKAEDVNSRYKYLPFTVVQVPCSDARSLCSRHLSFHSHPIIYSKIEIPSTLSLQLHLGIPCQVRNRAKYITRRHKSENNKMKCFIIISQKWCIQLLI